jgi:putative ABC transport system permease protein
VQRVDSVRSLDATVRRSDRISAEETGGIGVNAADPGLLQTLGGSMIRGRFLNAATTGTRSVVLGATAAKQLGIDRPGALVYIAGRWWTVLGIMAPLELAPELDRTVMMGYDAAVRELGAERSASTVYLRADPSIVARVHELVPSAANPEHPEEVDVSRPSDALAARAQANDALTGLFLGLGAVALLVGGIGIANTMVISVLERRSEIGLRRALGATKGNIRAQFLNEAVLLALLGGAFGVGAGALATVIYASTKGWGVEIPAVAWGGGIGAALFIGAIAGLLPAIRAARMSPTEALRTA